MIKRIEIISLIFKSVDYLNLIYSELKSNKCQSKDWEVSVRIVANDANEKVLKRLSELDINYTIYNDPKPDDYYLNRVYRCWNHAGITSKFENICFVNSDMVFSNGWLDNLLKHHNGINIPTSRLIESGKMPSGKHGISFDCGKSARNVDFKLWDQLSIELSNSQTREGGLYMPCLLERQKFLESGMYPEGNIYDNGIGNLGRMLKSGDAYYFEDVLENKFKMKHVTVFDSLVYHIQEGEKDEF